MTDPRTLTISWTRASADRQRSVFRWVFGLVLAAGPPWPSRWCLAVMDGGVTDWPAAGATIWVRYAGILWLVINLFQLLGWFDPIYQRWPLMLGLPWRVVLGVLCASLGGSAWVLAIAEFIAAAGLSLLYWWALRAELLCRRSARRCAIPRSSRNPAHRWRRACLRRRYILHARAGYSGDQACTALEGEVVPRPVHCDDGAIAKSDQEVDMRDAPEEPGEESLEFDAAQFHHRALASDRRERPEIPIVKWWQRAALHAGAYQCRNVNPLLLRDGCDARQWLSIIRDARGVTNDENIGDGRARINRAAR